MSDWYAELQRREAAREHGPEALRKAWIQFLKDFRHGLDGYVRLHNKEQSTERHLRTELSAEGAELVVRESHSGVNRAIFSFHPESCAMDCEYIHPHQGRRSLPLRIKAGRLEGDTGRPAPMDEVCQYFLPPILFPDLEMP